jgi:hypothetical protein
MSFRGVPVPIDAFPFFAEEWRLERLNRTVERSQQLMAQQIAGATGCDVQVAFNFLMYLVNSFLADPYLLIYCLENASDPPHPIDSRPLSDGPPSLPYICPDSGYEVTDRDELAYDVMFVLRDPVYFVVDQNALV